MKSIKVKIITLVLSCVILSSVSIGIISIWSSHSVVDKDSVKIMNLLCENKSDNFNEIFKRIEQSVETLSLEAIQSVADKNISTGEQLDAFADEILPTAINTARNTDSVIAVYLRFDPSYGDSKSGFFSIKNGNNDIFNEWEPTDLNLYSKDDREHVAWFYEAKEAKKPLWVAPYRNKNIDVEMISYVIPLYVNNEFLGVIGMDINFDQLVNIVAGTSVYDSGYAFLADDKSNIVYHKDISAGTNLIDYNKGEFKGMAKSLLKKETNENSFIEYTYEGDRKEATYRSLENGMRFILTAPKSEIVSQSNELLYQMILGVIIVISIAIVITFIFAKKLVQPLLEISEAAKRVASGDLAVSIKHQSKDEVGELAESFRQTVVHLDNYFTYINKLAYKDPLTGVKNKTAYMEKIKNINERIEDQTADFTLFVFDLNDLKHVNDSLGHDIGDLFIISASRIICRSFKEFPVYRIGGDEFVVLLEDVKHDIYEQCIQRFDEESKKQNELYQFNMKIFIAYGMSIFNVEEDKNFNDVFKKADGAMYQCKLEMKMRTEL